MRERIAAMRIIAHENPVESQRNQKSYYDRKSRDRSFKEGDKLLALLPSSSKKLAAEWQGPCDISRKTGPVDYEIDIHVNKHNGRLGSQAIGEDEKDIPEISTSDTGPTHVVVDEHLSADQCSELKNILDRYMYSVVFSGLQ